MIDALGDGVAELRPSRERYDALYLSPHLDDVTLSCGGQVHQRTARGERVLVVTLFTADVPEGPISELASDVLLWMGLRREDATEVRRREDEAACEILGAEPIHWPFPEATFRRNGGLPLYADAEELFGEPSPAEGLLVREIAEALGQLPQADAIVAPLGVGSHVDHQVVRRAAEKAFGDRLAYYEDFPYVRKLFALGRALEHRRDWREVTIELEKENLDARKRAIGAYRSQLAPLFGDAARMHKAVDRYARRIGGRGWSKGPSRGGERLWYRRLDR